MAVASTAPIQAPAGRTQPPVTAYDDEHEIDNDQDRIEIPAIASKLVEQGRNVPGVPDRITGTVGDTLIIENGDSSTQFVAGYSISPGQTLKIPLNRAGNYETNCSAHRDKSLTMSISES